MFNEQLKSITKEAHQELEKLVILQIKEIRSDAGYAVLLRNFYTYFGALEASITPFITNDVLPDFTERRKSANLKQDLADLGAGVSDIDTGTVALPHIGNALEAMGALYVMEGSTMGGGIIVKMLREKCNINRGLSFFSGYGDNTQAMWQKFTTALNSHISAPGDDMTVINAANETFKKFSILFKQHEQAHQL